MKNKLALSAIGGLAAALLISSFAFSQVQDQEKSRHIKLKKIENGKKMELDTVISGDDVFIWNGDTINPQKHIGKFSPSEFDKLHNTDQVDGQKRVKIYKHRGGRDGDKLIMRNNSGEDMEIITENGDTVGEKIIIRKHINGGDDEDHILYLNGLDREDFPPMPPMPGVPHIQRFRGTQSGQGINLNDPNVISFKKKDIGGGREKIEIIRKKTKDTENFNFEMEHAIGVPEPPAPQMLDEQKVIKREMKIQKQKQKVDEQKQKEEEKKDSLNQ